MPIIVHNIITNYLITNEFIGGGEWQNLPIHWEVALAMVCHKTIIHSPPITLFDVQK